MTWEKYNKKEVSHIIYRKSLIRIINMMLILSTKYGAIKSWDTSQFILKLNARLILLLGSFQLLPSRMYWMYMNVHNEFALDVRERTLFNANKFLFINLQINGNTWICNMMMTVKENNLYPRGCQRWCYTWNIIKVLY